MLRFAGCFEELEGRCLLSAAPPAGIDELGADGPAAEISAPAILTSEQAAAIAVNDLLRFENRVLLTNLRHDVDFTSQAVQFAPRRSGLAWNWQLSFVGASDAALPDVRLGPVAPQIADPTLVTYDRGGLMEQYVAHVGSVEQQFVIPSPFDLGGSDLVIAGDVTSNGDFSATTAGWQWSTPTGSVALGDVFVYDAAGVELSASMQVTAFSTRIVIDDEALAAAVYPVTVDPVIEANDYLISETGPVGDDGRRASDPAVAYNATENEFLVVWQGDHVADDQDDIFGQRIDALSGREIGSDFRISHLTDQHLGSDARYPAVAWDVTNNQYLVVWQGNHTAEGLFEIHHQLLGYNAEGELVEIGGDVQVSQVTQRRTNSDLFSASYPDVAYNGLRDEYLVVWNGELNTFNQSEILGARVRALDGVVLANDNDQDNDHDFLISKLTPAFPNFDDRHPAVVYHAQLDEFFVVWEGDSDVTGGEEILGQVLQYDASDQLARQTPDPEVVSDGGSPSGADVAYNSNQQELLVAWKGTFEVQPQLFVPEVVGQRYWDDPNDGDPNLRKKGDAIRISNSSDTFSANARETTVAYNALHDEYLVAWEADVSGDGQWEVFGQVVAADATTVDSNFRVSFAGPDGNDLFDNQRPAVGFNGADRYLAAWQGEDDQPPLVPGEQEIFGQFFSVKPPPVAVDDDKTAQPNAETEADTPSGPIDVMANDSDPNNHLPLSIKYIDWQPVGAGDTVTTNSGARVTLNADGTLTYDANGAFDFLAQGVVATDVFVYSLTNSAGGIDEANVTVTLDGVNEAPEGHDDAVYVDKAVPVTFDALANDVDPEGATLSLTHVIGQAVAPGGTVTLDSGARVTIHADATVTYDANGQFDSLADNTSDTDSFTYTVEDDLGATGTATVNLTVTNNVIVVDSTDDDDDGEVVIDRTLREAINWANDEVERPGFDNVRLANGVTYAMTEPLDSRFGPAGLPPITSGIIIEGNGSTITRSAAASDDFRLFVVEAGGNLTLADVTVTGGIARGGDGGWTGSGGTGGGGAALGGAVVNTGTLRLIGGNLSGNSAIGGDGGRDDSSLYFSTNLQFLSTGGAGGGGLGGDGGSSVQVSAGFEGGGGGGGGNTQHGANNPGWSGGVGGGAVGDDGQAGEDGAVGEGGAANVGGGGGGYGGVPLVGQPIGGPAGAGGAGGFAGGGGGAGAASDGFEAAAAGDGGFGGGGGGGGGLLDASSSAAPAGPGGNGGFGGGGGGGGRQGGPNNAADGSGGVGGGDAGGGYINDANGSRGGLGGGGAGMGGAVFNYGGTVVVTDSMLSGNTARGGRGGITINLNGEGGFPGDGLGGALFNFGGTVSVTSSSVLGNSAQGGDGQVTARADGAGSGGGIYNHADGTVHLAVSRIVSNTADAGSDVFNHSGAVDAENNWWGENAVTNGSTAGSVDFDPWLQLSHTADPMSITVNETATLTASLSTNSDGQDTSPLGTVPDGIPVAFSNASGGTLSNVQTVLDGGTATATFTAGSVAGAGSANAQIDNQIETASVTIDPFNLRVASFSPTASGFIAQFNAAIDPDVLNLYDVEAGTFGPADVTVVGGAVGAIEGSLVVDGEKATFVAQNGPLPADTYTVTLRSGANGFRDRATGVVLDGNGDGTPGDDFTNVFVAAPHHVYVGLPDFTRGPDQPVKIPADGLGLPLVINDTVGSGVTTVGLTVRYDPNLLSITDASAGPDAPIGSAANAQFQVISPELHEVIIEFTSPSALGQGVSHFITLTAVVPQAAEYGGLQVLGIVGLTANGGAVLATPDDAIHVAAFFGDTTGNGGSLPQDPYSGLDAQRLARVVVGLDSGFAAFPLVAPTIIGDVTGNASLSALDAQRIALAAVGLDPIEIPEIPGQGAPLRLSGENGARSVHHKTSSGKDGAVASVPHSALGAPAFAGRPHSVDLLTVVMHEMGHVLGLDHTDEGLMADTLPQGTRRVFGDALEQFLRDCNVVEISTERADSDSDFIDEAFAKW